ncbi:acyltransferase [Metabacillus idriensis]|uniref:acyltransferase n=1 Tax=Metabacillus idriensis TaxID=324768 RepID=UPI00203E4E78|nr:acyltransferase [Metabacillus idriensis]MCM3597511.1 acyltransferase [Metabacillus idriensis]
MKNKLLIKKIWFKLIRRKEKVRQLEINYYRSLGMNIGDNLRTFSSLICAEPYLLTLGNNVTISSNVTFILHDNSISKIIKEATDVFGKIEVGDNCFIGHGSVIMPGVILGENTIVGAGSIVTKSFTSGNVIIAGNPARIICSTDDYKVKVQQLSINTLNLSYNEKKEKLLNLPESMFIRK